MRTNFAHNLSAANLQRDPIDSHTDPQPGRPGSMHLTRSWAGQHSLPDRALSCVTAHVLSGSAAATPNSLQAVEVNLTLLIITKVRLNTCDTLRAVNVPHHRQRTCFPAIHPTDNTVLFPQRPRSSGYNRGKMHQGRKPALRFVCAGSHAASYKPPFIEG